MKTYRILSLLVIFNVLLFSKTAQSQCTINSNQWYETTSGPNDIVHCTGNVGIGTSNPKEYLHIGARLTIRDDAMNSIFGHNWYYGNNESKRIQNGKASNILMGNDGDIVFSVAPNGTAGSVVNTNDWKKITINNEGKMLIGSCNPPPGQIYNLYVRGGIRTEEVKVDMAFNAGWADYVFSPTYKLRTIEELKSFINKNKHLPNIPTEAEIKSDGINVAEISTKLLEKIEELSLYVIQLNEKNEELNRKYEALLNNK
jgi:hypothetical protein